MFDILLIIGLGYVILQSVWDLLKAITSEEADTAVYQRKKAKPNIQVHTTRQTPFKPAA